MTQRSFDLALRKGNVGERLVRAFLEKDGWIVYQPITDGAHCFDMLCIKDKRKAIAFDIKAKARLNRYPATGINQRHFEDYTAFSEKHRMPFWVVFVDEGMRQIYGNTIARLEQPRVVEGKQYPAIMQWTVPTRIWPLEAMRVICNLTDEQVEELAGLSQRSYDYEATP